MHLKVDLGDPRERRTIHLGIDLFQEPGTAIHAPLAGRGTYRTRKPRIVWTMGQL